MAKKEKYEIFEGLTGRHKKYIVIDADYIGEEDMNFCQKFFHCSYKHLYIADGYVLDDNLYFEKPGNKKAKSVYVVTYIR